MAVEGGALSFSVASVVEDVLQQHGNRLRDLDLDSRKAEEAGTFYFFLLFPSMFPLQQNSCFPPNCLREALILLRFCLW
jgi:hypothetical protein